MQCCFILRQFFLNFMQIGLMLGSALTIARESFHLFSGFAREGFFAIAAAFAWQKRWHSSFVKTL